MEKEYRLKLKNHLKQSIQSNTFESKDPLPKTPGVDLVQSLFPTPSCAATSHSRDVEALLDFTVSSTLEQKTCDATEFSNTIFPRQFVPFINSPPSNLNRPSVRSPSPLGNKNRVPGGGSDTSDKSQNVSSYQSYCSNYSARSKNATFRKRTSRELCNIVQSQCKMVESLNMVATPRIGHDANHVKPVTLWKSKKKFSSSVDLRSANSSIDDIMNGRPERSNNRKKRRLTSSDTETESEVGNAAGNAENLVRTQFTEPLIREVERVYVQNITTTADLLKKLERMPSAIEKALAMEGKM